MKNYVLLFLMLSGILFAQKTESPQFTYEMGGKIDFMKLTDGGVLIVGGSGGLAGIKPGESKLFFNFTEYGKIKEESIDFIPLTPYILINKDVIAGGKKTVLDYISGKILFSSENNGWQMTNRADVIMPNNKLVVLGVRQKNATAGGAVAIGIYDLATGKEDALIALNDKNRAGAAGNYQFTGVATLIKGGILVPTDKSLLRVDLSSGNIVWENKDLKKVSRVMSDESGNEIYTIIDKENGNSEINKVSSTGSIMWAKPVSLKGIITRFEITSRGLAVVSDVHNEGKSGLIAKAMAARSESRIAFLDSKTGADLWEKAPKTKDFVQHFYITDDGILFGLQGGGINKLSFDGQPLFKKPLDTGENIMLMALSKKGLIYITSSDANIIDLNTGESIWGKQMKYKKADAVSVGYDKNNQRYLLSTDEQIYAIDENTGNVSTLATVNFDGKEVITGIEVRNSGIFLNSSQNMMMLDNQGNTIWQQYFPAPGKSTAGKIFAGLGGAISIGLAVGSGVASGYYQATYNQNHLSYYKSQADNLQDMANSFADLGSASFKEMSKRFKASSTSQNSQFILTDKDKNVTLIKVNKDTGAVESQVILGDKSPEYQADDLGGYVYYKVDNDTIYAFDLN